MYYEPGGSAASSNYYKEIEMKKTVRKLRLALETLLPLSLTKVPGGLVVSGAASCVHSCKGTCGPCTTA